MAHTKKLALNSIVRNYKAELLVALATLLAFVVRISTITRASIWHDEGFSAMLANNSLVQIWELTGKDVHPPFYYMLLHISNMLFGSSVVSMRAISLLAGVLIVPLGYHVVKKVSTTRAAIAASFILALSPFLIRYSQEARMYGLLSLLLLIALYSVMQIAAQPSKKWPYVVYVLSITLSIYTHYFAFLAIGSFWLYLMTLQSPKSWRVGKSIFLGVRWWLANGIVAVLFLPWLPSFAAQITRGQGLSWLQPTNLTTFHNAIWQFFVYTNGSDIVKILYWILPAALVSTAVYLYVTDRSKLRYVRLLVIYSFVPLLLTLILSIFKPVFHERYFAFSVVGISMLLAIAIDFAGSKKKLLFWVGCIGILGLQLLGIRNVYLQANHQASAVMQFVNSNFQEGDVLVAGELYVYFDDSYYNKTNQKILLLTTHSRPNGFGESSLIHNSNAYLDSYNNLKANRVWVLGKTGNQQYWRSVPTSWQLLQKFQAGYSEVRLYQLK